MRNFAYETVERLAAENRDLAPGYRIFAVLDEAQDAATRQIGEFPATTDNSVTRSSLHELFRVFNSVPFFHGIILSGTGLSMDIVKSSVSSMSVRVTDPTHGVKVVTNTGNFLDKEAQKSYVLRYITLSDHDSDRRLLERIQTWFIGRCVSCPALFIAPLRL
jgi:hypothetical protein